MEQTKNTPKNDEVTLTGIIQIIKKHWNFLIRKWLIILIFGLTGSVLGLVVSLLIKPTFNAHLSFSLIEKSGSGGLADLASTFGFGGLSGNSDAFSGDNLLEIIQSHYAIEKSLLTPVVFKGERKNLVEVYIDFMKIRKDWSGNENLKNLRYPIGQRRERFTRIQDSVLYALANSIANPKTLTIARKDKKISIVNVDFKSNDELFSKLFIETLMEQTYIFYKETKTSQSRANVNMMQHTADSIKNLYNNALYKSAGISQVNINPALQFAAVPKIKQENSIMLYGTVYTEVLKNLETLKLDLARETPIIQIIDSPRLPLKKEKFGKVKGIILGGLLGGVLIVVYLLLSQFIVKLSSNSQIENLK